MHIRTFVALAFLLFAAAVPTMQQQSSSADARAVLDAALAAFGGADTIGRISAIRFREVANTAQHDQAPSPEPPYPMTRSEDLIVTDPYGERVYRHDKSPTFEQVGLVDGNNAWTMNPATRRAAPLLPGTALDAYRRTARRIPAFLVLEASTRAPFARVTGTATYEGRPHRIVEVPFADGLVLRLWFDTSSHLLSKFERGYLDATLGDTVEETLFRDYRQVGSLRIAGRYTVRRNSQVAREAEFLDIEVNPVLDAAQFAVPANVERRSQEPIRPLHAVTKLADRVYVLEQVAGANANVMFIAQDDGVIVVEAPEARAHRGLSERVIATIKQTLPGRPIRYVVPSHHHADHGAGLRPYIAEGATVITTPGNAAWAKRVAAAPFTLRPDAQAVRPRAAQVDTLEGKRRVIRSGSHVVELQDVGPEPHAQENVAVWLPAERILFLGDLFETGYREDARWDGAGLLGEILGRHKWDVDLLVTSHSRPRRMADLRAPETR
jgi:glyoxylase-like metal-dependent hydrolase (beta-lactamase superfamily II)